MSSTPKETELIDGKQSVEMEVDESVANKSTSIETSDGHNTSEASNDKKSAKKKKVKSSSANQSHKKVKKDPNKPEYPRVGM